jgi:hypothetical protein
MLSSPKRRKRLFDVNSINTPDYGMVTCIEKKHVSHETFMSFARNLLPAALIKYSGKIELVNI